LLFVLFAEDVGLLPAGLLKRLSDQTRNRAADFSAVLRQLFRAMVNGGYFGVDRIAHFNGGLFDDDTVFDLDSDALEILAGVDQLDWSSIEPSIFGTLFARSLEPSKRAQLGAQYTSKEDILLIVEPVLMAPLRRKWAAVQTQSRELAAKRNLTAKGRLRENIQGQIKSLLMGFADEIAQVRVLDPACGSGNFLYVSLRLLLDLQKEVRTLAAELGVGAFFPTVLPAQVHGIEVNDYAFELAQATIWIGYIQWLRENGFGLPSEPILTALVTIQHMDAIMALDTADKPVEPEWPEADAIVGNPPFLGVSRLRNELKDEYVDRLFSLYEGRVLHGVDLVCYWFEKARSMVEDGQVKRVGLLATQSIRTGASRRVLERIKTIGDIFWAQSDRDWILDGAAVRVSMVGFDAGMKPAGN
jgi:type II restriction/modification system DNA methylase subunit YeeA